MRTAPVAAAVIAILALLPWPSLAEEGWRLTGSTGIMNFVVLTAPAEKDADVFHFAVASICGTKTKCQVLFWPPGAKAPTDLPMSDKQTATQIAHWQFNAATGLRRFLWSCTVFPDTPPDECF